MTRGRLLYIIASVAGALALFATQMATINSSPLRIDANAIKNSIAVADTPTPGWDYRIVKVVDGDTVDIEKDGKKIRVRLIGLDTPELVDPRKPVQCFAQEASEEAKKVLSGQTVKIELDPSQGNYDKYGRLLAYLWVPLDSKREGLLFNKYMIAEGYGHEYTYNLPYKYMDEFKAAEKNAREQKLGLWADGACG